AAGADHADADAVVGAEGGGGRRPPSDQELRGGAEGRSEEPASCGRIALVGHPRPPLVTRRAGRGKTARESQSVLRGHRSGQVGARPGIAASRSAFPVAWVDLDCVLNTPAVETASAFFEDPETE